MPQLLRAIRPMFKTSKWRICRDDIVYILSGPDKGKTGRVLEVFKDLCVPQVVVEGRNLRKKKVRTGPGDDDYFVVTMEAPLHYSQVQVADPDTGRPTRVVFMFTPDGKMVRTRKVPNPTVNDIIPTPPEDPDPRAGLVGPKDTPAEIARRGTYVPAKGFPFRVRNLERIWAGLHPDVSPLAGDDEDEQQQEEQEEEGHPGAATARGLWRPRGAAGAVGGGSIGGNRIVLASSEPGGTRGLCTVAASAVRTGGYEDGGDRGDGRGGPADGKVPVRAVARPAECSSAGRDAGSSAGTSVSTEVTAGLQVSEVAASEVAAQAAAPPQRPLASSFALSGLRLQSLQGGLDRVSGLEPGRSVLGPRGPRGERGV